MKKDKYLFGIRVATKYVTQMFVMFGFNWAIHLFCFR